MSRFNGQETYRTKKQIKIHYEDKIRKIHTTEHFTNCFLVSSMNTCKQNTWHDNMQIIKILQKLEKGNKNFLRTHGFSG